MRLPRYVDNLIFLVKVVPPYTITRLKPKTVNLFTFAASSELLEGNAGTLFT